MNKKKLELRIISKIHEPEHVHIMEDYKKCILPNFK